MRRAAVMRRLATILWRMLKRERKIRYDTADQKKHQEFVAFEECA